MEQLYDYLFHYNPYQKIWYAFKREAHNDYFNGKKVELIKGKDIDDVITDILVKHKSNSNERKS